MSDVVYEDLYKALMIMANQGTFTTTTTKA